MSSNLPAQRDWILLAVDKFERPLTIYATRLVGDVDRARDVVQDTFMKLWQADRKTVDGHLAKWLYTVCRNRALDVRRKEHRMTTLEGADMEGMDGIAGKRVDGVPAHSRADGIGGSGSRENREAAVGMADFVGALPERQQEAVRLKFQGELSYREIAEVMNTTVSNVGVLLHTAIKSIRSMLIETDGSGQTSTGVSATR